MTGDTVMGDSWWYMSEPVWLKCPQTGLEHGGGQAKRKGAGLETEASEGTDRAVPCDLGFFLLF